MPPKTKQAEEERLLLESSRHVTRTTSALFYGNGFIVSALPLCTLNCIQGGTGRKRKREKEEWGKHVRVTGKNLSYCCTTYCRVVLAGDGGGHGNVVSALPDHDAGIHLSHLRSVSQDQDQSQAQVREIP